MSTSHTYQYPFFPGAYSVDRGPEPSDADATVLLRALADYVTAYAENPVEVTAADIAADLFATVTDTTAMSEEERDDLAAALQIKLP